MKISLRWLCDHLQVQWTDIDVNHLVQEFNTKTAEIEKVVHYKLDITHFVFGRISSIKENIILVALPELNLSIEVPTRSSVNSDQWYLFKKNKDTYTWASYLDMHSEKEGLLGNFSILESDAISGMWRQNVEVEDYILEVDNKSITHRPDMWGHRGFAREVGALLNIDMVPEESLLENLDIIFCNNNYEQTNISQSFPLTVHNDTEACSAIAALYIESIENKPSNFFMVMRLLRVESKGIDFIVDTTNYVMFDMGHPMHAFDKDAIKNNIMTVRMAKKNESLELLDGTLLDLNEKDIVIADSDRTLSLAGIKGGKGSGITTLTKNVILEAACFDAGVIRLSSMHHKIRTDASARFEKSLDPQSPLKVLARYIYIIKKYGINFSYISSAIVFGEKTINPIINIDKNFIESALGITLPENFIKKTLEKIEFKVDEKKDENNILYTITVPSFRATKDISIKEDIVEEIGRFYGYENISSDLVYAGKEPQGYSWFDREFRLKDFLVQEARMHEVQNYALFDNDFISKINWNIDNSVILKNPLSVQRTTMVTSLIPHLLQNIDTNMANNDSLAFFEWARIWNNTNQIITEKKVLAGIWYERKNGIDFYECKEHIIKFFELLDCSISWQKLEKSTQWASAHQTAQLVHNGNIIGKAGKVSNVLMHKLGGGEAFIFELDADFIKNYTSTIPTFKPIAKYQSTSLDITTLVSLSCTVQELTACILEADKRIFDVFLQDIFINPEWSNIKSVTMRFNVCDEYKTMDKQEIEDVYQKVLLSLEPFKIRN